MSGDSIYKGPSVDDRTREFPTDHIPMGMPGHLLEKLRKVSYSKCHRKSLVTLLVPLVTDKWNTISIILGFRSRFNRSEMKAIRGREVSLAGEIRSFPTFQSFQRKIRFIGRNPGHFEILAAKSLIFWVRSKNLRLFPFQEGTLFFNEKIRKRSQNFHQMGCFWVFLPTFEIKSRRTFSDEIWIFSWDAKSLKNLVLGVIYAYARDHRNQHDVYDQVSRRLLR